MPAIAISAVVGGATLTGGLAGLFLQSFLPEKHTTDRSRDMLAAIVGLLPPAGIGARDAYRLRLQLLLDAEGRNGDSRGTFAPTRSFPSAIRTGGRAVEVRASGHTRGDRQRHMGRRAFRPATAQSCGRSSELAWHGGAVLGPEPDRRRSKAAPGGRSARTNRRSSRRGF